MFQRRESFIGVYDNVVSKNDCNRILSWFEDYPNKVEGVSYNQEGICDVDYDQKRDIEVPGTRLSDGSLASSILIPALQSTLLKYHRKYSISLQSISNWKLDDSYNIQKYTTDRDGFKAWHCEAGSIETSHRILAWMVYLNNAKSGTQFIHHQTVKPKAGRTIIWPAYWTHVHKSVTPNQGIKYIATGWASYEN